MATVYLIRHGQASFGKENYDQLSPRGWEQGRVLGRWLQGKVTPAFVFGGQLLRHRETAEAITSGYGEQLPDMQGLAGLNEFDHEAVVNALRPAWADRAVMARELASHPKPAKAFQEAFVQAVERWASGQHDADYEETWPAFQQRVLQAFDNVLAVAEGRDVLVSTSGGPIAVIAQSLLGLSDSRALRLNEVIANTSVTRVLYSGRKRSLSVFNNYSHLEAEDLSLVTFR